MYADCDPRDADRAFEALRPQANAPYAVACPVDELPGARRTYVLCSEDQLVNPDWSRRASLERLGVEPIELPGSHSPFISRPNVLARLLHELG